MAQPYQAVQLERDIWSIEENGVRSFLVAGDGRAMLVDTGMGAGDIVRAARELTGLPLFLVNTHADPDHTGCNRLLESAYMHPAEFEHAGRGGNCRGVRLLPLWEGEEIRVGRRVFEVVLIPGHTPGSIALFDRADKLMICGDTVQTGPVFMFGPGRNLAAYLCSLEKLQGLAGGITRLYPSHGELPVGPEQIAAMLAGAQRLQAGELTGREPGRDLPCKLYDAGDAKFLF